jgi:hypothetical protein
MYRGRRLQDFVNSTSKFSSIVTKTLKPVLCSSCDDDSLNFEKKSFQQYSFSAQILAFS